jgi:hypothetical protein
VHFALRRTAALKGNSCLCQPPASSLWDDDRRFTRLTNAFSKKIENHAHSVALFALYYNFVRVHKTLRVTPAMAAGITKRLWEIGDIVDVLEAWEAASVGGLAEGGLILR